jgi:hypothetical protein
MTISTAMKPLTAKQILANQKAYRQTETTLQFGFDDNQFEDDLNDFLSAEGDDYECEVFYSTKDFGGTIVRIETTNRADAEKYYDLVDEWAMEQGYYSSHSSII